MNIIPLPAFRDNYIWTLHDGRHAVVVDPGDAGPVSAVLSAKGLQLSAILVTHHHPDHVGGIATLVERWPVPVFGPAHETIAGITHRLAEGDRIRLPGLDLALKVLEVPRHSRRIPKCIAPTNTPCPTWPSPAEWSLIIRPGMPT